MTQAQKSNWAPFATMLATAAVALIGAAAPALGQTTQQDPRWRAWIGCWNPTDGPASALVCVLPAAGRSAVDIATVAGGKIVNREHVDADGERHPGAKDQCIGGEVASWSASGKRVYLRGSYTCSGDLERQANTLIAMSRQGEWLSIQAVSAGGNNAVRVVRYRLVSDSALIPAEARVAIGGYTAGTNTARLAAGAPVTTADIIDASKQLDVAVVEAWLAERNDGLHVNAAQLVKLADGGVPGRVTDLLVALSYPDEFDLNPNADQANRRENGGANGTYGLRGVAGGSYCDPYRYSPYSYSPFGWDYDCPAFGYGYYGAMASPYYLYNPYGFGFGYGYGGGWYPGQIVVVTHGTETAPAHGRVVNGHGYSQGGGSSSGGSGSTSSGSGSSGSKGSGSSTSPGGATSSPPARTAVPKKPPQLH